MTFEKDFCNMGTRELRTACANIIEWGFGFKPKTSDIVLCEADAGFHSSVMFMVKGNTYWYTNCSATWMEQLYFYPNEEAVNGILVKEEPHQVKERWT